MAKVPAASTTVALIVLSINLSICSCSLPSSTEDEEEEAEQNPSNDRVPSLNPPTWLAWLVNSPSSRPTTTPSCISVLSWLCTGITSSSSCSTEYSTQLPWFLCLFLKKMGLCESFEGRKVWLVGGFEFSLLGFERERSVWAEREAMAEFGRNWVTVDGVTHCVNPN